MPPLPPEEEKSTQSTLEEQLPFIGGVVLYNHPNILDTGKYLQSPAIIMKVYEDDVEHLNYVDLTVFSNAGGRGIFFANHVPVGREGFISWMWPVTK